MRALSTINHDVFFKKNIYISLSYGHHNNVKKQHRLLQETKQD